MENIINELKQIAEQNPNGFTVSLPDLQPVTSGWIVAMKETQNCFGNVGLEIALEVALKTSKIIGGWKEGKKWYWDASLIYNDEKEAVRAGLENGQIAIYNIETATLLYI
jgi:hypothetical protein